MDRNQASQSSQGTVTSVESLLHDLNSEYDEDSDSTHFSEEEPVRGQAIDRNVMNSDDDLEEDDHDVNWDQEFDENDAIEFEADPDAINSEVQLSNTSGPLVILQNFITDEMVEKICIESNRYAEQKRVRHYSNMTPPEFWRFVAVSLGMGVVKKTRIEDYWAVKTLFQTPFFSTVMPRDRYRQLLRTLHFMDNTAVPNNCRDKFVKLGTFMEDLFQNVRKVVKPGEYLCLDESLVPFKGRLSIKQFNPKKRARFGVKLFKLADCSTKMIIDILPYQGANTKMKYSHLKKDLGFGGAAVLSLLEPYFNKGHRVVVDNYFNSPKLARFLKAKKTYVLGTVQKRRKGMPKTQRMQRKMKKGEVEVFSDGDILVERWCDRRDVHMLNTFLPHSMINVESANPNNTREKPGTVVLYNAKMGAVDDSDKVTAPLASTRKSYKWYRKVVFHLVDLAAYNAFLMFQHLKNKKSRYRSFLEDLIKDILVKYPSTTTSKGRPPHQRDDQRLSGSHFPQKVLKNNGKSSKADCVYCKLVYKKRSSTVYGCRLCKKRLCIGAGMSCFELYHTQTTLRKVAEPPSSSHPQNSDSVSRPPLFEEDNESYEYSESLLA